MLLKYSFLGNIFSHTAFLISISLCLLEVKRIKPYKTLRTPFVLYGRLRSLPSLWTPSSYWDSHSCPPCCSHHHQAGATFLQIEVDMKLNLAHWSPVNLRLSELTTTTSIGPASPNLATVPRYNLQLVNDQRYYCAGVTPLSTNITVNCKRFSHWSQANGFSPMWSLNAEAVK